VNSVLSKLIRAAEEIEAGEVAKAETLLALAQTEVAGQASPMERLSLLFIQALQARIHGDLSGTGNLYGSGEPLSEQDMLLAYQTLVEATPIVRFGYGYANQALFQALKDEPRIHLIDIGIGMGTQWLEFFEQVAHRENSIHHIRLTGIDLPFSETDPLQRLRQVALMLHARAAELGLDLTFEPIASRIESFDFTSLALSDAETLAISCTLVLHHTPAADAVTDSEESRDAILNRIRQLEPRILTLVEPDSEHNALPLLARLPEAFRHYLIVFEALDAVLADSPRVKGILESAFFGREIINIVSAEGQARVERHERSEAWRRRLSGIGFRLIPITRSAIRQGRQALRLQAPFTLRSTRGMVHLHFGGAPILATSAWAA